MQPNQPNAPHCRPLTFRVNLKRLGIWAANGDWERWVKNRLGIPSTMAHPSYANLKKPGPDEIVIRYTSLAQFIWIVTQQKLPLIRVDLFRDPFEGSAPRSLIEHQMILSGGRNSIVQQMAVQQHHFPNHPWPPAPLQTAGE